MFFGHFHRLMHLKWNFLEVLMFIGLYLRYLCVFGVIVMFIKAANHYGEYKDINQVYYQLKLNFKLKFYFKWVFVAIK